MQADTGSSQTMSASNDQSSNNEKPWMRSWEMKEVREHAEDWSLAADAGLLKYLEAFSVSFMQKAQDSTKGIYDLVHDTSMTDARVRNVTDKFMTLSDSQFIENRVYDEDVSAEGKTDDKTKDEENKDEIENIDPFPKLKTAIQMGIKVLEESFDILDPNAAGSDYDSELDSEDDDGINGLPEQRLYEPKDPYVMRPLPHLIGSRGFQEYDDVGIRDLPSDDEIALDDQGSISESDEDIEKPSSRKDSISSSDSMSDDFSSDMSDEENEMTAAGKKKTFTSSEEEEEDDDDEKDNKNLFGDSEDDLSDAKPELPSKKVEKTSTKKKTKEKKKKPVDSDIFASDHSDDDGDLFRNSGGLFSNAPNLFAEKKSGGGLFDGANISDKESEEDSNNENDAESLTADKDAGDQLDEKKKPQVEKSSKPSGGISLFGGALNKELLSKTRKDSSTSQSESVSSAKRSVNLFDGDDSDEDDLFASKPQKSAVVAKIASKTMRSDSSNEKPSTKKKIEIASKKKPKSDLFGSSSSNEESPPPVKKVEHTPKKKAASDLFGSDSKKPPLTKKVAKNIMKKPASDLFGSDSDDGEDALFNDSAPKTAQKKPVSKPAVKTTNSKPVKKPAMFDSGSSDEDSMFSSKPPPMQKLGSTKKKSKGLFDSDSDDDFFTDLKPKSTNKTSDKTKALLDSDDDLFPKTLPEKVQTKGVMSRKPDKPVTSKSSSLFGDSDDDDVAPISNNMTGDLKSKKSGDADDSPLLKKSDDLFGDSSEDDNQEPTPPPTKKKPAGAVAMFGGGFGGGELSAAILKRRGASVSSKSSDGFKSDDDKKIDDIIKNVPVKDKQDDAKLPSDKPPLVKSDPDPKIETKLPFNSTAKPYKPFSAVAPPKKSAKDASAPSSSVSSLRSNLSINPSSLLPGAAPKPKPVVKAEISFDKPPDVKTLNSVNKTRAKGQRNRRPPSRHFRGALASKGALTRENAPDNAVASDDVVTANKDTFLSKNEPKSESKIINSVTENVFDNTSSKNEPEVSKKANRSFTNDSHPEEQSPNNLHKNANLKEQPTLSGEAKRTLADNKALKEQRPNSHLRSASPKEEIKSSTKVKESLFSDAIPKSLPVSLLDDSDLDDELFGGSLFAKSKKQDSTNSKVPKLYDHNDIFGDADDDDFLTSLTSKGNDLSQKNFDITDDDDIFGDLSIDDILSKKNDVSDGQDGGDVGKDLFEPSHQSNKQDASMKQTSAIDIFGDDDNDDIFGDKSKSLMKKKPAEEQGASDNDDIFGGKSNSTTKKKPSKAQSANNDDDIFGEKSSPPTKEKLMKEQGANNNDSLFDELSKSSKSKAEKTNAAPTTKDDIFDDDIFSSIPTVTKKKSKKVNKKAKSSKVSSGPSIFDDDDGMDDIFASSSSKKKKGVTKSSTSKKVDKSKDSKTTPSSIVDDPLGLA